MIEMGEINLWISILFLTLIEPWNPVLLDEGPPTYLFLEVRLLTRKFHRVGVSDVKIVQPFSN
jgi:hypothetical protein